MLGTVRRRSLLLASILAAALTSTAIHTLVVSQARYNLPLMPALLAGGVAGWVMFLRGQRAASELPGAAVHPARSGAERLPSVPSPG